MEYYLKMEDDARNGNAKHRALVQTLKEKGRWPAKPDSFLGAFDGLRDWYGKAGQHWENVNGAPLRANERPQDPELLTRHEIQEASPDLLVTNYSMLEYMLLRPIERKIFADTRRFFEKHSNERFFFILDEAHLYRGANGTEVAYLVRRLLDLALDRLEADLKESGASVKRVDGGLIDKDGQVICLAHPFTPDEPCSERARKLAAEKDAVAIDVLLVLRALPVATNQALSVPRVDLSAGLKPDSNGVPELTAAQVAAGALVAASNAPRFAVANAEECDFLFRLDANTLSQKKNDGGEVIKGTMCLFRPYEGPTGKKDVYLVRRTDGQGFGATGAPWTVGILQAPNSGGVRVRYLAASQYMSQYMECASELVQPAETVVVIAQFVRAVH